MTDEEKAEEYVRTLRVAGINSYNHCNVEKAYLDGLADGRKETAEKISEVEKEIAELEDIRSGQARIINNDTDRIERLEKENAELKELIEVKKLEKLELKA